MNNNFANSEGTSCGRLLWKHMMAENTADARRQNLLRHLMDLKDAPVTKSTERSRRMIKSELDQFDNSIVDMSRELSDETLIRHYVSIPQFISIIDSGQIWLSSVSEFSDTLEGAATKAGQQNFSELDQIVEEAKAKAETLEGVTLPDSLSSDTYSNLRKVNRNHCLVSCWRLGENKNEYTESAVFWNSYVPNGIGVAIESRVGSLKAYLRRHMATKHSNLDSEHSPNAIAGSVSYAKEREYYPVPYPNRLICKRSEFNEEKEYRIVVNTAGVEEEQNVMLGANIEHPKGEYMMVNPQNMINKIYVSPNSPSYVMDSVQGIVDKYNGFTKDMVEWSELRRSGENY